MNDGSLEIAIVSERVFSCSCQRVTCIFGHLTTFQEHIARLYRLSSILSNEELSSIREWNSIEHLLLVAGSIRSVSADTAYADNTESYAYCDAVSGYEDQRSEYASSYVASLSVFTFLWMAYEDIVRMTMPERLKRLNERNIGERGRRLLEEYKVDFAQLRGLVPIIKRAENLCLAGGGMENRLKDARSKCAPFSAAHAAEICREFRNFIMHGGDRWLGSIDDSAESRMGAARILRLLAVSRLIALLMQTFIYASIADKEQSIGFDYDDEFKEVKKRLSDLIPTLHLEKFDLAF